jgi:heptosyltransferase-1
MDILIVKLGALGDVINTLPLAARLKKHYNARIHWLVAPLSYPVLSAHPCIDEPILLDLSGKATSRTGVLRRLRHRKFDMVLDLQRILKSGLLSLCVPAGRRIGFDRQRCKEMTWLLPFERISAADPKNHMLLQYLEFADYLGVRDTEITWGIHPDGPLPEMLPAEFVVLNIGATKPANRWTPAGFGALARLIEDRLRLRCVLTGGKEDRDMAEHIVAAAGQGVVNRVGVTSIPELIRIMGATRAVVTCDTGPMHLAVALNKKVVALFGPSDHRRTGPFRGKVIRRRMDCAPCNKKSCQDPRCMAALRAEDVFRVLAECLG